MTSQDKPIQPPIRSHFPEISELTIAAFYRIKTTIVSAIVLAAAFGMVAAYLVPGLYVSNGLVRVRPREGFLFTNQQSKADDALFVRAQQSLAASDQTLRQALHDSSLQELMHQRELSPSIDSLRSLIRVEIPPGSEFMNISASSPDPELALHVSRAATTAYLGIIAEQLKFSREQRIRELEIAANQADDNLQEQWRLLQSKAGTIGTGNPQSLSTNEQIKVHGYRESAQRLRELQLQKGQLEVQMVQSHSVESLPPETLVARAHELVQANPEIVARKEQLRQIDVKIRDLRRVAQDEQTPRLVRLVGDREHYQASLSALESALMEAAKGKIGQSHEAQKTITNVQSIEGQLALIDHEMSFLQESMTRLESGIEESSGTNGVELEIIRHEIERQSKLADSLWKTLQELKIEERAEPRVSLVSLPVQVEGLNRSKQIKGMVGAVAIGLFLAILIVGYVEWNSNRIRSPRDIEIVVGLPVFGGARGMANDVREAASQFLLMLESDTSRGSILITSATQHEPRSVPCAELVDILADSGRDVLLVNLDARDTLLTKQWANGASRRVRIAECDREIQTSSAMPYDYLGWNDGDDAFGFLASGRLPKTIEALKQRYDAIVVLGPPVLENAETVLIAASIDASLMVTRPGRSRTDCLDAARRRLEQSHSRILGALFHHPRSYARRISQASPIHSVTSEPISITDEEALLLEAADLQQEINPHGLSKPHWSFPEGPRATTKKHTPIHTRTTE